MIEPVENVRLAWVGLLVEAKRRLSPLFEASAEVVGARVKNGSALLKVVVVFPRVRVLGVVGEHVVAVCVRALSHIGKK